MINSFYNQDTVIICDSCHTEMDREEIQLRDNVLGQDRNGKDIIEKFFECPNCERHYTATVYDEEIRQKIFERQKMKKRLKMSIQNKSKYMIMKYRQQLDGIKEELMEMQEAAKRKYIGE